MQVLEKLIKYTLANEHIRDYEVGVTLVDDEGIRKLNKQYRKKDEPTDVLSFHLTDETPPGDSIVIGDIVISMERALKQSLEYGHSLLRETAFLLVHGIYHLLGYTHDDIESEQKMRKKEEEILKYFKLSR